MPRFSVPARSVTFLGIAAGVMALGAVLGVLYVILSGPVHAVDQVPPALAKLIPAKAPRSVPAVAFSDATGKRHLLSEFKGRYVLLNLWATWCNPCVRELPALAGLQAAVPPDRLKIVAVNVGRSNAGETAAFLRAHGAEALSVYLDTNVAMVRAFRAYGLPLSVLIDPQGREVARGFGGANWDTASAIAYFKALPMPGPAPARAAKPARAGS